MFAVIRSRPLIPGALSTTLFLLATSAAAQTVFRVDADAPPGGDGSSWPSAFHDLADALAAADAALGPAEIWVAAGVYRPDGGSGDVELSFDLPGDVRLLGGFAGDEIEAEERDPTLHETILSGDLLGDDLPGWQGRDDNTLQVVRARDLEAPSEIDGFTIRGGNADFDGNDLLGGGGIFLERSDLAVRRSLLVENTAGSTEPSLGNMGGAIYAKGFGTLTVDSCRFERNRANAGGAIGALDVGGALDVFVSSSVFHRNDVPTQSGGAIRFAADALVVRDSEFTEQHAGYGAAIHATLSERIEIRDSTFERNVADVMSAALWLDRADDAGLSPVMIERSEFVDNWTDGGFRGGTIHAQESILHLLDSVFRGNFNVRDGILGIEGSATVTVHFGTGHRFRNCLFEDNVAGFVGAVELIQAGAEFLNCTFVHNRAASSSAIASGIAAGVSSVRVENSIFWNNRFGVGLDDELPGTGGEIAQTSLHNGSTLAIDHSLLEGWTGSLGGVGNGGDDPLFVDPAGGDLRLSPGSPAIDAGDNAAVPPEVTRDLDGNPRIVDGDGDLVETVDIGAYELVPEIDVFADGFESGDTTSWSSIVGRL